MPRVDGELRVTATERRLVEWVAQAKVGDPLPHPWTQAYSPLQSMIRTLVDLGVITHPGRDADLAAVASSASGAARAWLAEHPPPTAAPPRR